MKRIKNIYHFFIVLKKLRTKDNLRSFDIKFGDKIKCWRKGFLPESFVIYNFKETKFNNYLSDYKRLAVAYKININNSLLIDNKFLFAYHFKKEKAIPFLFYVNNGDFREYSSKDTISSEALLIKLKEIKHCVFKVVGGGGGKGITFVDYIGEKWKIENKTLDDSEFCEYVYKFKHTIISSKIIQNGFCSELFADSLNTIRILTMINPSNNKPFIAAAVLRCGRKNTGGLDNWSSGGLSININLENGKLSKAVSFPNKGKLIWYKEHPDSEFLIEGNTLPNWEYIKKQILKIADKHFYLPYVGWDIVPFEDDFKILEANGNSDINLLQVHQPLLARKEVREFYKFHGVIDG